ncbi:hypothetical protein PASLES2_14260 [Pseudomonas aeruginosa]
MDERGASSPRNPWSVPTTPNLPLASCRKVPLQTRFLVHSWLALPIWFFVLIVCVTGTLAVVSQEIVWLANPDVRASKPYEDAEPLSFSQVLKAINEAQPDLLVESIQRPDEEHFALTAEVSYPGGSEATLYINPYTGAIQGESPSFDFRVHPCPARMVAVLFNNGYSWGWYMVSLLGLPMLGIAHHRAGGL